jgi:ABC-2 type transport system ATP-binding protein
MTSAASTIASRCSQRRWRCPGGGRLAEGLTKRYGETTALDGLDLELAGGTVLGLLVHNGAGKTTAVRIFATLLRPDAGRATVHGRDVVREPAAVRELTSLAGQQATLDERLTGRENLVLLGRLQRLSRADARARSAELLRRFELDDAADRVVSGYSGGMRRRLDLAACLLVPRPVVFLDEPTTGLDPVSRAGMWSAIRGLVDDGAALLLTTQYLEEADRLADRITVLSAGRVVAEGAPSALKDRVGGRRVEAVVATAGDLAPAAAALAEAGLEPSLDERERRLSAAAPEGAADLARALDALNAAEVGVEELGLRLPTLDDVLFALTGHAEPAATREAVR